MRIEKHYNQYIVCGDMFAASEIEVGSLWQGSGGSRVTVTGVCDKGWVSYCWMERGELRHHQKDSFSFQCRYCLVLDSSAGDE